MKLLIILTLLLIPFASTSQAGFLDSLSRGVIPSIDNKEPQDNGTIVSGLKDALAVGTERAVNSVSKPDGYLGNQMIKILLPERLQQAAELLGKVGYQKQVDHLVTSMNRAAEKAAPTAAAIFGDAIRSMTVEDAKGILDGGDTAATVFFEKKTRDRLLETFKPVVVKNMEQVGTARAYKEMLGKYQALPVAAFAGKPSLDLESYVTNKSLDGLFKILGEEEKKIRNNPAARTTELLKKIFGDSR